MSQVFVAVALLSSITFAFDCSFYDTYPKQYVAYYTKTPLVIDGSLTDKGWAEVPWTDEFVDISTATKPKYTTQAKIRYDDNFLYIGAMLEETQVWANISSTCHCISPDEDQVIFHDNDFEIFVDSDGSTHYYKEYEMNAYNATWDLCLNRPYSDGGYENSSRVFGKNGFDMQPPLTCATHIEGGQINNPQQPNKYWSVEVALPLAGLQVNKTTNKPGDGKFWRVNFSRVEWGVRVVNGKYEKFPSCQSCPVPGAAHEDNWVWSPQGVIDMHQPESWGMLQFSTSAPNSTRPITNPEWPLRYMASTLYHAQQSFLAKNGTYTARVADLIPYAPPHTLDGTCSQVPKIALHPDGFYASIGSLDRAMTSSITEDRLLSVSYSAQKVVLASGDINDF